MGEHPISVGEGIVCRFPDSANSRAIVWFTMHLIRMDVHFPTQYYAGLQPIKKRNLHLEKLRSLHFGVDLIIPDCSGVKYLSTADVKFNSLRLLLESTSIK